MIITNHAKRRFRDRWKYSGSLESVANKAFKKGKGLSRSLLKNTILLGIKANGTDSSLYRVYRYFLFIYERNDNGYVLTTLFPLSHIENRAKHRRNKRYKSKK